MPRGRALRAERRAFAASRTRGVVPAIPAATPEQRNSLARPVGAGERPQMATNPGGFIEHASSTATRVTAWSSLPDRGAFTFPAPYNTTGIRITHESDMAGADALWPCGYSYWSNINAHESLPALRIFLGTDRQRGGVGPMLYELDKRSDAVTPLWPLFGPEHPLSWASGEGWYWSRRDPDVLYCSDLTHLYRLNVVSGHLETVATPPDASLVCWQWHTSDDERTHSATLKNASTYAVVGVGVYREHASGEKWSRWPARGALDECQIDKSGEWLLIKDNVDAKAGEDNRIVRVATMAERTLLDPEGAAGHSDNGFRYMVAADNWNDKAGALRVWMFDDGESPQGALVYHTPTWDAQLDHVSHCNARDARPETQYVVGSGANRANAPRNNEIIAFRLDASLDVLVIAPCLVDLDAPGGRDDYSKLPKGNVDISGQYFLWTSNHNSDRLDAFIVKVPSHLLMSSTTTPPAPATCLHCPEHCPPPPAPTCSHACAVHCP